MKEQEINHWIHRIRPLEHETPYLLVDTAVGVQRVRELKENLPDFEIYYAIKSFNDPRLISAIDSLVDGYDVASLGECQSLIDNGISSKRMIFSNPTKMPKHISESNALGVDYFAFDSVDEIHKIAENAPSSNVYLRVVVPDQGSSFSLSKKFGVDPIHVVPMMSMAKELGLNPVGLAFHVGSQSENPFSWKAAIEMMGQIIERLKNIDIEISFLDMGGGFPSAYTESAPGISLICDVIKEAVSNNIPSGIRLAIEPGRFVAAPTSVLVTSVSARAQRSGNEWLYLDVGAFNGVIEPLELPGWQYPIALVEDSAGEEVTNFILTGPTCDSCDTFGQDISLPSVVRRGDRLMIGNAGAYTVEYASNFNGFDIPKRYYIDYKHEK